MTLTEAREYALSLPEAHEEPHFQYNSFRVRGKIFATVPTDGDHLHIFVGEERREQCIAIYPDAYEKLWWGKKVVGLKVQLSVADADDVRDLLCSSWKRKAPKRLIASMSKASLDAQQL